MQPVNLRCGERVGVWLVGALGDIATTMVVGTLAVRAKLNPTTGLVTALSPFDQLPLPRLESLVFGGSDIRLGTFSESAEAVSQRSRTYDRAMLDAVSEGLASLDANIVVNPELGWKPSGPRRDQPPLSALLERLRASIRDFSTRHDLARIVVVDLSSSEPAVERSAVHQDMEAFHEAVRLDRKHLVTPSMLNACAAFHEGCAYVNFTPNMGANLPALQSLAERQGVPFCGSDGKTGETLVKTALAPMFAYRNLRVLSWEGNNLLGNDDGKTLADPDNRVNKLRNKGVVLEKILGYPVHSGVSINYVPSLGDWKTAWDLIHFEGFLGVKMSMQFTWQGCDSILAAPLVLDLIRFSAFAAEHGEVGPMRHLASFFKNPIGVDEMALPAQFNMLTDYALHHLEKGRPRRGIQPAS